MAIVVTIIAIFYVCIALLRPSAATEPNALQVFNPTITYPTAGVVWHVGSNQTVAWKTSDIPRNMLDYPGTILLGHIDNDDENLDMGSPLASGFRLRAGFVHVVVPKVAHREDYVVVLLGDSGNISPKFAIAPPPMD